MPVNPKLEGSNIVDCVPQRGNCPIGCIECFYNKSWFADRNEPLIPTPEEAKGKIVRMNTGHDSNLERLWVLNVASKFEDVFFNTSIPFFDFPGPVVFTCNGAPAMMEGEEPDSEAIFEDLEEALDRIMFVRFRLNPWNTEKAAEVVDHYVSRNIPVVMTFMRYYTTEHIRPEHLDKFEQRKHLISSPYQLKVEEKKKIMARWSANPLVFMCGTYENSKCADCGVCSRLYRRWKKNHP